MSSRWIKLSETTLVSLSRRGELLTIDLSPDWFWVRKWNTFLGACRTLVEAEKLADSGKPLPIVVEVEEAEVVLKKMKFKWSEERKGDSWTAPAPEGERHPPRVVRASRNSDDSYSFYCYRGGKVLGVRKNLDDAKKLVEGGQPCTAGLTLRQRVDDYVKNHAEDAALFFGLTPAEQRYIKWLHPKAAPKEATYSALKLDPWTGEHKPDGILAFREPRGRRRAPKEPKTPKEKKEAVVTTFATDAIIRRIKDTNPNKPGSAPHKRWEYLFEHDGRTVDAYQKNDGNMVTLTNAVKKGYVEVSK